MKATETYPTTLESFILVYGVVLLLGAIQRSHNDDHHRAHIRSLWGWDKDEANSRVVNEYPPKPNCRPSLGHANSWMMFVLEACSPCLRARRNQNRENYWQQKQLIVLASRIDKTRREELISSQGSERAEVVA